jgi:PPOX class probable F420-dependent enzyme
MADIPEEYRDLLVRPVVVSLGVTLPNGRLQVLPIWCDYDGGRVRINTATTTARYQAWQTQPQATVLAVDPDDPFRYLEIRGRVVAIETAGADAHIDALSRKYLGVDTFPWHNPSVTRAICSIQPERVITSG